MTSSLRSIVEQGTKLWLDSIDPDLIRQNATLGATGATSNPIIIADLIDSGRFDDKLQQLLDRGGLSDERIAWEMTDHLVNEAQQVFLPIWERTQGDDGYVSFELDPLLEDPQLGPPHAQRVARYIELGVHWSGGHRNRMIKVPATAAGLEALEELAAAGVTPNVTLIFTARQYRAARDAVWRGRQRFGSLERFKSVYSIFISRIDAWTHKHLPHLSEQAQGMVGIVNAKRIWSENRPWWRQHNLPLSQQIIFASTGTKFESDPPDKYVAALVGSDIQTNPPATNEAVEQLGKRYERTVDRMPPEAVLAEIDQEVDMDRLEKQLMDEGVRKFADPHKQLIQTIAERRKRLAGT